LARELKIQTHINHPNIVKVYGFFADLLHFYIVMECALDGHLSDYMEKSIHPLP
jgi:serine/threonine protein kinase